MTPEDWSRCKDIFGAALEKSAEERVAWIAESCGGDEELRRRVEAMLAAADDDTSPLDKPAAETVAPIRPLAEPVSSGDILGRYRVLRSIGQGGTSLVYLAEHVDLPSQRRFAIKVITPTALVGEWERFERECEILAALEHPNIARILDRGTTATGWPYLVLDYIDGVPIHSYCREKKLAPPEIVRLLIDCCRAVSYIHGHQVAHCDLKPNNILVNTAGTPLILDFGISRMVDPGDKTRVGETTRGIRPLTPEYASPEQLEGGTLTEATDIYSLGVILYETLTGRLPFDDGSRSWDSIQKRTTEDEPPPPSQVVRQSGSGRRGVFRSRLIRGDLDSIVVKALSRLAENRYPSVDALAADLTSYVEGEPVDARRSNAVNRTAKWAKRHRRISAEALAVGLMLILVVVLFYRNNSAERSFTGKLRFERANATVKQLSEAIRGEKLRASDNARAQSLELLHIRELTDRVPGDASEFNDLAHELAESLCWEGDGLGNPYEWSLGRVEEARADYLRAFELLRSESSRPKTIWRAEALLGLGDTFGSPWVVRDATEAIYWYEQALKSELPDENESYRITALAHGRLASLYEMLGGAEEVEAQYDQAREKYPMAPRSNSPVEIALYKLNRGLIEAGESQRADISDALQSLSAENSQSPRLLFTEIEAHLALGLYEAKSKDWKSADHEFSEAARVAEQEHGRDPEDVQCQRAGAVALRRRALCSAELGRWTDADLLRKKATEMLQDSYRSQTDAGGSRAAQQPAENPGVWEKIPDPAPPIHRGDYLIADGQAEGRGGIYIFSYDRHELQTLVSGHRMRQMRDMVAGSQNEFFLAGGGAEGVLASVVSLKYDKGHWSTRRLSGGGNLHAPASLSLDGDRLLVADAADGALQIVAVDLGTGRQSVLGKLDGLAFPGRMVAGGATHYVSVFWPGEGGPAEVLEFDAKSRQFRTVASYRLLEDPVTLALIPPGNELLVGDRNWVGRGGSGRILRVGRDGTQVQAYAGADVARITALTALSEREALYATAWTHFASSGIYSVDLKTGQEKAILVSDTLQEPRTLLRVDRPPE